MNAPAVAPSNRTTIAVCGVLTLIWGTTFAAIRFSLDGFPPFLGAAFRFALGALALFLLGKAWKVRTEVDGLLIKIWAMQVVCAFCVPFGAVYWAEQWVPTSLAAVLFSTMPLWVAIFSYFVLPDERLGPRALLGIVVGFAGILVIFAEDLNSLGGPNVMLASLVLLISPFSVSIDQVCLRRWGQKYHSLVLNTVPMAVASLVFAIAWLILEQGKPITPTTESVAAVFYLAWVGTAVTFGLYFWLLQHISAIRLSMIAYGTPVVAIIVGVVWMDETLSGQVLFGALLVVSGVAFVATRKSPVEE